MIQVITGTLARPVEIQDIHRRGGAVLVSVVDNDNDGNQDWHLMLVNQQTYQ